MTNLSTRYSVYRPFLSGPKWPFLRSGTRGFHRDSHSKFPAKKTFAGFHLRQIFPAASAQTLRKTFDKAIWEGGYGEIIAVFLLLRHWHGRNFSNGKSRGWGQGKKHCRGFGGAINPSGHSLNPSLSGQPAFTRLCPSILPSLHQSKISSFSPPRRLRIANIHAIPKSGPPFSFERTLSNLNFSNTLIDLQQTYSPQEVVQRGVYSLNFGKELCYGDKNMGEKQ